MGIKTFSEDVRNDALSRENAAIDQLLGSGRFNPAQAAAARSKAQGIIDADRIAGETQSRHFRQHGLASVGSFMLGGALGGAGGAVTGGAAAVAGAPGDSSQPQSVPPLDVSSVDTSLPASTPGDPLSFGSGVTGGGEPTGLGDPFGGPIDPAAFTTDAGVPTGFETPSGLAQGGGMTPGFEGPASVAGEPGLGDYAKFGIPALGAIGGFMQRRAAMNLAGQYRNLGAAQRGAGEDLVAQYRSGKLNPADQFAIDQWETGAIAQTRDYYARAGLSDSSMAKNAENAIHAQAVARKQEALNNMLAMGTNILNITDRYQAAAVQAEMAANQALGQMAIQFMSAYGNYLRYFG